MVSLDFNGFVLNNKVNFWRFGFQFSANRSFLTAAALKSKVKLAAFLSGQQTLSFYIGSL
jgi:hypothetical protein